MPLLQYCAASNQYFWHYSVEGEELALFCWFELKTESKRTTFNVLRGAWRDRDTNDIFGHCGVILHILLLQIDFFHSLAWNESFGIIILFKVALTYELGPEITTKRLSS